MGGGGLEASGGPVGRAPRTCAPGAHNRRHHCDHGPHLHLRIRAKGGRVEERTRLGRECGAGQAHLSGLEGQCYRIREFSSARRLRLQKGVRGAHYFVLRSISAHYHLLSMPMSLLRANDYQHLRCTILFVGVDIIQPTNEEIYRRIVSVQEQDIHIGDLHVVKVFCPSAPTVKSR